VNDPQISTGESPSASEPAPLETMLESVDTDLKDEVREILCGLEDRMEALLILHNQGCDRYLKLSGVSYQKISEDDITATVVDLANRIAQYNIDCMVYPKELDTTKVITFAAPLLMEKVNGYSAVPLFFEYINFLDDSYIGTGMTIRSFGDSRFFAENLQAIMSQHWMAPFCFFRAIDLSFDRCALPRIFQLNEEINNLRKNPGADPPQESL
jgi:hypothetical protein